MRASALSHGTTAVNWTFQPMIHASLLAPKLDHMLGGSLHEGKESTVTDPRFSTYLESAMEPKNSPS